MTTTRKSGRNSSSISIRKAHPQRCATDTNEHEKAQSPTLSIEALRAIRDLVRRIKARINDAGEHDQDTATCAPLDSVSTAVTSPMGGQDPHTARKEKQ
jgi:hypothetical protein